MPSKYIVVRAVGVSVQVDGSVVGGKDKDKT